MSPTLKVGFVGLGDQGAPMAQMIIKAGFPTTLWARRSASLEPFLQTGANTAESLMALGSQSDVVGVCVHNDDDVREVINGDGKGILYGMKPGGVIAIHSTVKASTCIELQELGSSLGIHVIDAPVSGGSEGALAKSLTVMAGGNKQAFEKIKPVLLAYGDPVCHMGPIGSGQQIKALNNVTNFANMCVAQASFEVAEKLGMDPTAVRETLIASSASSEGMKIMVNRFEVDPVFASGPAAKTMAKDVAVLADFLKETDLGETLIEKLAKQYIQHLISST